MDQEEVTAFIRNVLEYAAKQNEARQRPDVHSHLLNNEMSTHDHLVQMLGSKLAEVFNETGSQTTIDVEEVVEGEPSPQEEDQTHYEELVIRNRALASALGACDCWGEDDNCGVCHGQGKPGWTWPERKYYNQYISPAVKLFERLTRRKKNSTPTTYSTPHA